MTADAWLAGLEADVPGEALSAELEAWRDALPGALREVANRIVSAGGGIWLVGGSVREALLGRGENDHDLATTLHPDEVLEIFPRALPTGVAYGTVTVRLTGEDLQFEVTSLRSEGSYGDGRRPDRVVFGESLHEDLSRRDFTINSIAIDLARGLIHDPFDGRSDLTEMRLRAVGEASERLGEDGLRLLRAYRFMDQGDRGVWQPDAALAKALIEHRSMLEMVANERVWAEFRRILVGANAPAVLERMRIDGMLSRILPGWDADLASQHALEAPQDDVAACRLVLLASEIEHARWRRIEHDLRALTLSNRERGRIMGLHRLLGHLPYGEAECRRYRVGAGDLLESHLCVEDVLRPEQSRTVRDALAALPPLAAGPSPLVDGHALASATDLPMGRRLGQLKSWLHRMQIELDLGEVTEVIGLLDVIDWKTSDPEVWPGPQWP
jgi:tRNA nucleotidyltransferase (CCA-adding enzyme)